MDLYLKIENIDDNKEQLWRQEDWRRKWIRGKIVTQKPQEDKVIVYKSTSGKEPE